MRDLIKKVLNDPPESWKTTLSTLDNFVGIPRACTDDFDVATRQLLAIVLALFCCSILVYMAYAFFKTYAERLIPLISASRSLVRVFSCLILVVLFMNPPTTVPKENKTVSTKCQAAKEKLLRTSKDTKKLEFLEKDASGNALPDKLLELEVKKVFDELQTRIGHLDSWYHWKFALVGSVILLITGFKGIGSLKELQKMITSPAIGLLLASACVIALAADIHMRIESAMTGMLGRWISGHVEPSPDVGLYWETYLRTGRALHTSLITQFTFLPHLHFLTWPVYISYMWVFQEVALRGRTENTMLIKGSFVLVQSSLFIFVLVAHSTPLAYGLMVFEVLQPGWVLIGFIVLYFVLILSSTPYFAIADRKPIRQMETSFSRNDDLKLSAP